LPTPSRARQPRSPNPSPCPNPTVAASIVLCACASNMSSMWTASQSTPATRPPELLDRSSTPTDARQAPGSGVRSTTRPAWPTSRCSRTRSAHGGRVPAPRGRALRQLRHHHRAADHRQRLGLPLKRSRNRMPHTPDPPPPDPALPPPNKRESRTLHQNHARRLGLRRDLPLQPRTERRARRLVGLLQSPPTTRRPQHKPPLARLTELNNLLGSYMCPEWFRSSASTCPRLPATGRGSRSRVAEFICVTRWREPRRQPPAAAPRAPEPPSPRPRRSGRPRHHNAGCGAAPCQG
jgi:hypothetical protein